MSFATLHSSRHGLRNWTALAADNRKSRLRATATFLAKLKALLRKAAERSIDALWTTIGRLLDAFTPTECANYFRAAGYEPE